MRPFVRVKEYRCRLRQPRAPAPIQMTFLALRGKYIPIVEKTSKGARNALCSRSNGQIHAAFHCGPFVLHKGLTPPAAGGEVRVSVQTLPTLGGLEPRGPRSAAGVFEDHATGVDCHWARRLSSSSTGSGRLQAIKA